MEQNRRQVQAVLLTVYCKVKIMVEQKQLENVESFKYLGSILTMMEGVLVKLNVGLLWLKLHLTRRGLFLLAHWTWN
jgi:hypothetical protein